MDIAKQHIRIVGHVTFQLVNLAKQDLTHSNIYLQAVSISDLTFLTQVLKAKQVKDFSPE